MAMPTVLVVGVKGLTAAAVVVGKVKLTLEAVELAAAEEVGVLVPETRIQT